MRAWPGQGRECTACGGMAEWFRQGPAKPCTRVRFPLPPRGRLAQRESASLTRKRSLVQSQYRPRSKCRSPVAKHSMPSPALGHLREELSAASPASGSASTAPGRQPGQSTATPRALQISRIRVSANRPSRLTSTATETLSTESRLTAERRGTGSSPGSRSTSLASPRIVVVHGGTSARRCRGITASRDKTTTGRRPISAISHHHTSPRAGNAFTRRRLPVATTPGRPTRRAR